MLIGRKLKNSLPINRSYSTKRIKLIFNKGFLFYAEYNIKLFFILLFTKKDILLANDLDTLLPNFLVSKLQRKKIVFDSHELFSEVPELTNKPTIKLFWSSMENFLIPKLKNCYTVCQSIANYYKKKYSTQFEVIKNVPVLKNIQHDEFYFAEGKKIIIYQGAVNVGRGLELMIETMQYLNNHIFIIIGYGDIFKKIKEKIVAEKLFEKVKMLGKVHPKKLQKITPNAHLGISLEEDLGLNYRYALPNKIFDYIQAEIPILVSNLPEMSKVVTNYNVGEKVNSRDPKELAEQIERMLEQDFSLSLKKAKRELTWSKEEKKLIHLFKNLM